jgi:hypothetical protein
MFTWLNNFFINSVAATPAAEPIKHEDKTVTEPTLDTASLASTGTASTGTATSSSAAVIDAFAANLKAILAAAGKDISAFDEAVALAKKA